jgi:hypothetical protein
MRNLKAINRLGSNRKEYNNNYYFIVPNKRLDDIKEFINSQVGVRQMKVIKAGAKKQVYINRSSKLTVSIGRINTTILFNNINSIDWIEAQKIKFFNSNKKYITGA